MFKIFPFNHCSLYLLIVVLVVSFLLVSVLFILLLLLSHLLGSTIIDHMP